MIGKTYKISLLLLIGLFFIFLSNIFADTLILKDGTVLQGTMKSATEFSIMFEVNGKLSEVKINDINTLTFSPRVEPIANANTATTNGELIIPANTKITAKTSESISTASNKKGSKVTAKLELDIIVNGNIIVPKGSTIYGTVTESIGGRRIGNQSIKISFNEIVVNGKSVAIITDPIGAGGRGSAAKLVGASALIGHAAGDAGKGAAVGAGLALLAGGKHIEIPKETLFDLLIKNEVIIR